MDVISGNVPKGPKAKQHPNFKKRMREFAFVQIELDKFAKETGHYKEDPEKGASLAWDITVLHGKAQGVDTAADFWAVHNFLPIKEYPANWDAHGKQAGPIRNKQMLDKENPDIIIAFPGGKGTENMVTQARKRGFTVRRIKYEPKV